MTRSDYATKDWSDPFSKHNWHLSFWTLMLGRAGVNRRIERREEKQEVTGWDGFVYGAPVMIISGFVFAYAIYGG